MLTKPSTCPICENTVSEGENDCPSCHCTIQFTLDPPTLSRSKIIEGLVQQAIDRSRSIISMNPRDSIAHYILGLSYLNYGMLDQGIESLQQAATFLPEKHSIRFELAMLQTLAGRYAAGLDQITQAFTLAPENRNYQYLRYYLSGMTAQARQETSPAVTSWIAAYQLAPEVSLASKALGQFVAAYEPKLTQPIAHSLHGLDSSDAESLRLLNNDPAAQKQALPRAPKAPGELGKMSLGLLRRISPARAVAIEQMHTDRIASYQTTMITYEAQRQDAAAQREATLKDWQARAQAIRSDLPLMTRLCLAVYEEEERRRVEEERRRAEAERRRQEAEQRRLADQQRRAQEQAQAAVSARNKKVREQRYLSTKAQYIQGLPKGKEKDTVNLTVTNLQITIEHGGMLGSWEYTIPMESLVEVAGETIKHLLSSEKRLRISYRDDRGMVAHALFADLKVDDCVKNILKARTGK